MRTAAKTMVELLGGTYRKARGFFIMKWAAGRIVRPCFFKRYSFIHDIDDVDAIEQLLDEAFWNQNNLFNQDANANNTLLPHSRLRGNEGIKTFKTKKGACAPFILLLL